MAAPPRNVTRDELNDLLATLTQLYVITNEPAYLRIQLILIEEELFRTRRFRPRLRAFAGHPSLMDDDSHRTFFRFERNQMDRLARALQLPRFVRGAERSTADRVTALAMMLRRMAYPNRQCVSANAAV